MLRRSHRTTWRARSIESSSTASNAIRRLDSDTSNQEKCDRGDSAVMDLALPRARPEVVASGTSRRCPATRSLDHSRR